MYLHLRHGSITREYSQAMVLAFHPSRGLWELAALGVDLNGFAVCSDSAAQWHTRLLSRLAPIGLLCSAQSRRRALASGLSRAYARTYLRK